MKKKRECGLMTMAETADYLGMTGETLKKIIDRGELPALSLGGRKYCYRPVLDEIFRVRCKANKKEM